MTGPFDQKRLYVTPWEEINNITLSRGEEVLGLLENVGRLRCELEGCIQCGVDTSRNVTFCSECGDRFSLINGNCQSCGLYDQHCTDCTLTQGRSPTELTSCSGCDDGYRLDSTKTCVACSDDGGCKTCNENKCFECNDGYLLDDFGQC